ncbi:spermidine synthase [Cellulomonas fengjieae]|uniref:Spermidine synthase n=1 Tax=Cellulomonas fengjieae TaxID=2819978 RepID=A0ABS3SI58_9CELL|nr:spermidine synthase [Cellulomonas fengjieae]MBO3085438.1 spermidine synthase [Cellulomonas fengjieae]MBO3101183.1 spermidine synthase [Cellulomonas fengjieae]QVI66012.1 spermidine synthase [Cellulomonas fengjieae]
MPEQPVRRPRLEELAWEPTTMGDISLRRRQDPVTGADVLEVKLGDEFLMSSLFTVAEEELARLGLAMTGGSADGGTAPLDVVVGGLGLGYTALTVLEDASVGSLVVVDALAEVIDWHHAGLIPAGAVLTADPRCRLVHADFFAALASDDGLDPGMPGRRWDAVLVDIDHSPRHLLNPSHASFYTPAGLQRLREQLKPGGVFALWSNDPPDEAYLELLRTLLVDVRADVVAFPNPLQSRDATNTVYLGRAPG